ncbi:MAG: hypothetical protein LAP87_18835 [Acidobacteriia bacterium]|nr:hypothetical protein [Terriglobia bacterium]
MAGSTTKKVVIRRFEKESVAGWVNPASYLQPAGVEVLSAQGNVSHLAYGEIKTIVFVRDFEDAAEAGHLFLTRPKTEGLWVSFQFRDGEVMEGIMSNNLLQLEQYGFTVIPPSSSHQRVFIPRAAVRSVEVLGVVGSPLHRRKAKAVPKEQIGLFEE